MAGSGSTVGGSYTSDTAAKPWSLTTPDGSTLQFQVRKGDIPADLAAGGIATEESIAVFSTGILAQTPTNINFSVTVAPGAVNTAPYLVLAQLNQGGTTSNPPFDIDLAGDQMVIYVRYMDANGNIVAKQVYADPTSITRGHAYNFDIRTTFDAAGNGRLQVVRDGVTLVDYSGPLGYAGNQNLAWQEGIRRGVGASQTISASYSNLSITSGSSVQYASPTVFLTATTVPAFSNLADKPGFAATYAASISGLASWNSTVALYVDGVYAGYAKADGAGAWTATVDVQSLGAHAIYAVATNAAGVSSATSYAATVKVGTVGDPGQVQPGYYFLDMNGISFNVQNASKAWSLSEPDANTLRFEVRNKDFAYYDFTNQRAANRSEVADNTVFADGTPIQLSYGFNVEPGPANTSYFMVLGQLHQDTDTNNAPWGPPFDIGLQGEVMTIDIKYSDANGNPVSQRVFTDIANIQRGHYYAIDIKVLFDPNGNGRLVVTRDGVTIVDYAGPLGYTSENGVYWKEGVYRNSNALETFAADYRNLTITTGAAVTFPDPSAFIAAPIVGVSSVSSPAADGSRTFSMQGTAKAGTTVTIFQNGAAVASGLAGANGSFTASLSLQGTGEFLLSAVATDSTGRNGLTSAPIAIEIGTAASIVSQMSAFQALPNLAAIVLTDTSVLTVTSTTQLSTLLGHDAGALSKIQGGFTFSLTQQFSGKSYDTQTQIYSSTGILKEVIRSLASVIVYDQAIAQDGSQVVRTVGTNGAYTISSVAANGSTLEIDQFTPGNLLFSKDQRFPDGTRLVTTWSQSTGAQTGYIQYNADKSYKAVTIGITGQVYTSQALSYNAAGKLILQERFTASGIRTFSSSTSPAGVQLTQNFNASTGVLTSSTAVNPDGSSVQAQFGITGQAYAAQVLTYDKTKALIEKDLLDANGVLLSMDTWSPGQWHRVFTVNSGVTTGYTQINTSDNTKSVAIFAAGASGQLASLNIFNASGTLVETDLYGPTGQKTSVTVISGGVSVLTTYDPTSGLATGKTQTNSDNSRIVTVYTPGLPGQLASVSNFNASGALVEIDLYNASGSKTLVEVFGPKGSRTVTAFDPASGAATGYTQFNTDGSFSVSVYATGSSGQLATVNLFNPVGTLVETDTYNGGQQVSSSQFANGTSVTTYDPASGIATGATVTNSDGSKVVAVYATGLPGQMSIVSFYTSSGTLAETDLYNPAGLRVSCTVPSGSGTLLTSFDPMSGLATGTTQTNGDGSKIVSLYVVGVPGQLAQVQSYNANGVLLETDLYSSGKQISTDVFTAGAGDLLTAYDPSTGLATGTIKTNADGSRIVSVFAAGAPGVLASVKTFSPASVLIEADLYNAGGQRISSDVFSGGGDLLTILDSSSGAPIASTQTNSDGSKVITAFANGVIASTKSYTSAGLLTETDLYDLSGRRLSTDIFGAKGDLLTTYDPLSKLATGFTQTNADGSQSVGTYASGLPGQLATVQIYDPSGTLIENDVYSSSGFKATTDVFYAGGADVLTTFDPTSGLATGYTQTNADGSRSIGVYAAGLPGNLVRVNYFNASGALVETDLYNSKGQKISTDVVLTGGGDLVTAIDPGSTVVTSTTQTNADGSYVVSRYGISLNKVILQQDFYNSSQVLVQTDRFNFVGVKVSSTTFASDQSRLVTAYDSVSGLATSATQINADGTRTVSVFAVGVPGQVQTFYKYNASGVLTEADLYNPVGQKLSVVLYNGNGSSLRTTFDPQTGIANGTTLTNADGSRVVSVYAAGTAGQLASVSTYDNSSTPLETDLYDAFGKKISAVVYAADGSSLLTTYDPLTALATGTTQVNADGSQLVTLFTSGLPGQPASVSSYDPSGTLTERDLYNALGQRLSTDVFTAGSGDLLTSYDPASGLVSGYTQTNSDGSKLVAVYVPGQPGQLATTNAYNAVGVLTETDVYAAGRIISVDVFTPGAGDLLTTYDPSTGLATGTTQTFPDSSKTVTVFAVGIPGQPASVNRYTSTGALTQADLYNALGQKISSDVVTPGAGDLLTSFDPLSGTVTGTVQTNADNSKLVAVYMAGSSTILASLNSFNASGLLTASQSWGSDGSHKVYAFDPKTGLENGYTLASADGSRTVATFAPGSEALLLTFARYGANGALLEVDNFDSSGHKIGANLRFSDGSRSLVTYDALTGAVLQSTTYNADKTRTEVNNAIVGKPHVQQTAIYDATGKLISMVRTYGDANQTVAFTQMNYPDGSSEVHNYDTSGREVSRILTAFDGSRDAVTSTYTGTSTTPVTVVQDHFGSNNIRQWTDTIGPDGSHKQVAAVAGASLTTHAGVSDTFTSASAGSDVFVFKPAFGQDIITNFHAGTTANRDTIDLTALGLLSPGQTGADYLAHALTQVSRDVILTISNAETITFKNTQLASLVSNQFKL